MPAYRQISPAPRPGRVEHVWFEKLCQVKSSQVVGLRDRVAIIRALLHAISSPQPYAGYGDLSGYAARRNLSVAACYRSWPLSR